jgi:hypothetical protein
MVNGGMEGIEALSCGVESGYTDIVKLLLSAARVNVVAGDNYAIRRASEDGHTDGAK